MSGAVAFQWSMARDLHNACKMRFKLQDAEPPIGWNNGLRILRQKPLKASSQDKEEYGLTLSPGFLAGQAGRFAGRCSGILTNGPIWIGSVMTRMFGAPHWL